MTSFLIRLVLIFVLIVFVSVTSLVAAPTDAPATPVVVPPHERVARPRAVAITPIPLTEKVETKETTTPEEDVIRISDARSAFTKSAGDTEAELPDTTFLLQSARTKSSTDLVEMLLEASGTVRQVDENAKAQNAPMEIVAGFRFEERTLEVKNRGASVAVRQYNLAKAKLKFGETLKTPELDAQRRTIVARCDNNRAILFSPQGPLKADQFLLIEDIPANTLAIDRLLPTKRVAIGDSWEIDRDTVQAFLSIDAITSATVTATLTAIADDLAMIDIVGEVEGVCLGAATEMSLKAKLQFDLKTDRVNWVGMVVDENRSMSYVGPAMEIAARIQIKISPDAEPQSLTDDRVASIKTDPQEPLVRLAYSGNEGGWRFQHDRDWYIFNDSPQETILRLMRKGELVAQCTVADAGQVAPEKVTPLAKFADDLAKGLVSASARVVAADEYASEVGYKEYRVVLDGTSDDLVLRWVYYLLTDPVGNQVMVVFVVEAGMLESFGFADADFVETVRIGK
ncbi:MAG: hypothetical protein ACRC46_13025 [Thermoguttaceae bacterium]